jgi:hypothetical protein
VLRTVFSEVKDSWLKHLQRAVPKHESDDVEKAAVKVFRLACLDFHKQNPKATVAEWVDFATSMSFDAWASGVSVGAEYQLSGELEVPQLPDGELHEVSAMPDDLSQTVLLQGPMTWRNGTFVGRDDE